jgi:hypothetical protein
MVAKALQLRGADVLVLICSKDLPACEPKMQSQPKNFDPCWQCGVGKNFLLPLYKLNYISIGELVSKKELNLIEAKSKQALKNQKLMNFDGIDFKQTVHDSLLRHYRGNYFEGNKESEAIKLGYIKSAFISSYAAKKIKYNFKPNISFSNQWIYSWQFPFTKYFNHIVLNSSNFNFNSVQLNLPDLFPSKKRFNNYLKHRNFRELNKKESLEIRLLMKNRFNGNAPKSKLYNYFENNSKYKDDLFKKIKANSQRKLLLCSNIFWDAGLSENCGLFDDVISWVYKTIDLVKKEKNLHLYIKPHPGEVYDSLKSSLSVSSLIRKRYKKLPKNITIIEPTLKINTYDLFKYMDAGVIFTGTLGLEMLHANLPVISTGLTTHHGLGFASEPKSINEYLKALKNYKKCDMDKKKFELFLYFYFIKSNIPWTLTKKSYGDKFNSILKKNQTDLLPGKDKYLDHLCNCIVDYENTIIESWN